MKTSYEETDSGKVVRVHETGKVTATSKVSTCMQDCLLHCIPSEETAVRAEVSSWDPPTCLPDGLKHVFNLTKLSSRYNYSIRKYKRAQLNNILNHDAFVKDEDVIIRPVCSGGIVASPVFHACLTKYFLLH